MAAPVADGFAANGSSACSHFIYATTRPEGGFPGTDQHHRADARRPALRHGERKL